MSHTPPNSALSTSPGGESFPLPDPQSVQAEVNGILAEAARHQADGGTVVVVQGLGFVGSAVAAVIAAARTPAGRPRYFVIGVDLATPGSFWKIAMLQKGKVPFPSPDPDFDSLIHEAVVVTRNLRLTTAETVYDIADVIVVDVNLDAGERVVDSADEIHIRMDGFSRAVRLVGSRMRPEALVLVETTVPVGTCEQVVEPILREERERRGISEPLKLAHAYERVMPGPRYVDSIRRFWRSYSGIDAASAEAAASFLSGFIDTATFPLRQLERPAASELAKVLENSYRAVNIAFMYEWTLAAEQIGVNLFDVVESIRVRKGTHDNMRYPGFGVGGYCLTKDSYLAQWGIQRLLGSDVTLEMTLGALRTNYRMPRHTFDLLHGLLDGDLKGRRVAILGVSYLPEVGDTRSSPTEALVDALLEAGAFPVLHDPHVRQWLERPDQSMCGSLEETLKSADALVLAVPHRAYLDLSAAQITAAGPQILAVVDAQNILSEPNAAALVAAGRRVAGVGKGHWRRQSYHQRKK